MAAPLGIIVRFLPWRQSAVDGNLDGAARYFLCTSSFVRGPRYNDECALAKVKYHTKADHCANGTITKSQWLTLMGYCAIVQPTTRQSRWEIPPKNGVLNALLRI